MNHSMPGFISKNSSSKAERLIDSNDAHATRASSRRVRLSDFQLTG
jgi:hypothetical protein